MTTESKYGEELTDIGHKRVQIGTATLPDGTVQPVFEIDPYVPLAYRHLIEIVTNQGQQGSDK